MGSKVIKILISGLKIQTTPLRKLLMNLEANIFLQQKYIKVIKQSMIFYN